MVTEIPLTKGYVALIDDEDAGLVNQFKWFALIAPRRGRPPVVYAVRSVAQPRLNGRNGSITIYMHKFLMPGIARVDHKDGNGLNNRRSTNLRAGTQTQNLANTRLSSRNRSGFKGIHWSYGRWRARIQRAGQSFNLGAFDSPEDAAKAYDHKARELFGEFARVNFPRAGEQSARL